MGYLSSYRSRLLYPCTGYGGWREAPAGNWLSDWGELHDLQAVAAIEERSGLSLDKNLLVASLFKGTTICDWSLFAASVYDPRQI
jgi:hypothetical protein